MGKIIAGTTLSLDGFMSDHSGRVDKLYTDFAELPDAPSFQAAIRNTGAVIMGRRTFEMGEPDAYAENYEFQVPIFVLTHTPPAVHPRENDALTFTFVTDGLASAISQAQKAAGDKEIQIVGGASTIQQALNAGLCDELHVDIIPILLGQGLRLLENIDLDKVKLEKLRSEDTTPTRTSIVYRQVK